MNEPRKVTVEYPIQVAHSGDFPLLDEVIRDSMKIGPIPNPDYGRVGLAAVSVENARKLIEGARESGELEPLASLSYSMLSVAIVGQQDNLQELLIPYQQHVDDVRRELSQNLRFEVQQTPGNAWDVPLASGLLLYKSGGNIFAYRHSVESGGNGKFVRFKKLPNLKTPDLEEVIGQYQNPVNIESHVLVHSTKPYSTKGSVLPHFAYNLIGLGQ